MKFTAEVTAENRLTIPIEIMRRGKFKRGDLLEVDVKPVEEPKSK
jgi:bifunctional DNA-binding transcriptional regulator/antitoxin component of YhaV-PrlF toxin-antitoxin module